MNIKTIAKLVIAGYTLKKFLVKKAGEIKENLAGAFDFRLKNIYGIRIRNWKVEFLMDFEIINKSGYDFSLAEKILTLKKLLIFGQNGKDIAVIDLKNYKPALKPHGSVVIKEIKVSVDLKDPASVAEIMEMLKEGKITYTLEYEVAGRKMLYQGNYKIDVV